MDRIPLFGRKCSVEVNSTLIQDLRIVFDVAKDIEREPNRAHVMVYNLSETSRKELQDRKSLLLRLIAGYEDVSDTLFMGDVTHIISYKEGPDWVTKFAAGDGVKRAKTKRVSVSKKAAGGSKGVIKTLLDAMGAGEGNLNRAMEELSRLGKLPPDIDNAVLQGNAAELIHRYAKDAGLEHSSQDGVPTFTIRGSLIGSEAVVLSPDSGLLESPELSKKGLVKAKALIQKGFTPGRGVQLDSKYVKGLFQVHKVKYNGDTHGQSWYADLELLSVR